MNLRRKLQAATCKMPRHFEQVARLTGHNSLHFNLRKNKVVIKTRVCDFSLTPSSTLEKVF